MLQKSGCRLIVLNNTPLIYAAINRNNSIIAKADTKGGNRHRLDKHNLLFKTHGIIPTKIVSKSFSYRFTKALFSTAAFVNTSNQLLEKMNPVSVPAPAKELSSLSSSDLTSLFKNIDSVIFDCDCVLWHGMETLENAQALVIKLRKMGKKVFFITNNSNRTRAEFLEKFNALGFEATVEEIVGTAYLTALYLQELNFQKKVYIVGPSGVTKELEAVGIQSLPIGPDVIPPTSVRWNQKDYEKVDLDPEVGAVVVGFDQHFSYLKILKAATYLSDKTCLFIATNTDEQFPGAGRIIFPGTGTFVNAVKTAAAREPVIMGKPERFPFELLRKQHNLAPERVLMVGDRGNTDILFGRNCGLLTLLVLTGVTDIDTMHKWEKSEDSTEKLFVPDYYSRDVNEVYQLISSM